MGRAAPAPAERVRARLRAAAGAPVARTMPAGYQRLGRVLLLRLPPALRPWYASIGAWWQEELGVATVLVRRGPIDGELRRPDAEVVAGGPTETEVVEHGARWRFDAARQMFAQGNRTERHRLAGLVVPGERVADLFAGVGYFTVPIARRDPAVRVVAVEKNPEAYRYLEENVRRNGVADRVRCLAGDNRQVVLPPHAFDRVLLGYLPDAVPWIPRAVGLVAPGGGWVHVHAVADARGGLAASREAAVAAVRSAGGSLGAPPGGRVVKPYGPGRIHAVVDLRVVPG
jgi:tRNA wybutosine-synthesizing protein 2